MSFGKNMVMSLILFFSLCSCTKDRLYVGREYAVQQVQSVLADSTRHPVYLAGREVPDRQTAIGIAEPVLFERYGREHILGEQPYEVYKIDGCWVLMGSLPKGYAGGTFLMVMDASDGAVLRLTHGK